MTASLPPAVNLPFGVDRKKVDDSSVTPTRAPLLPFEPLPSADMSLQTIRSNDVSLQPWRNGGGQTRELLAWPSTHDCKLRIALADIEKDGPFSTYDGVERWIVVISGVGIELNFGEQEHRLLAGDEPLCFDGADAPDCRLIDGPTRDLNLMVQGGSGAMRAVRPGVAWSDEFAMRGVFASAAGKLQAGGESRDVPAMSLLWADELAGRWTFDYTERQTTTQAWWLGFTPSEEPSSE